MDTSVTPRLSSKQNTQLPLQKVLEPSGEQQHPEVKVSPRESNDLFFLFLFHTALLPHHALIAEYRDRARRTFFFFSGFLTGLVFICENICTVQQRKQNLNVNHTTVFI